MIFKFYARGETSVFCWVDLSAIISVTADRCAFELDLYPEVGDADTPPFEVDIIRSHPEETSDEATIRVIEAWTRARQRKANW
jgi:hypothetical protein